MTDTAAASDIERYCELAQELDEAGEAEIDLDFDSPALDPDIVSAEFSDFVDAHSEEMEELERVAPTEIADDVEALNGTIREVARTGDLGGFEESEDGDERIREFEDRECGAS